MNPVANAVTGMPTTAIVTSPGQKAGQNTGYVHVSGSIAPSPTASQPRRRPGGCDFDHEPMTAEPSRPPSACALTSTPASGVPPRRILPMNTQNAVPITPSPIEAIVTTTKTTRSVLFWRIGRRPASQSFQSERHAPVAVSG